MNTFNPGDHLVTNIDILGLFEHHGLYVGDERVIHLKKTGVIEKTSLFLFSNGNDVRVKKSAISPQQAIDYARSKIGYSEYNVVTKNCEQFVNECLAQRSTSNQVSNISHLTVQGAARVGLLGTTASQLVTAPFASLALTSTATKMAGEYIGLPDDVNNLLGTPGDLIGKTVETLYTGVEATFSDTTHYIACGDYDNAVETLVEGALVTGVETVLTVAEVGATGFSAAVDLFCEFLESLSD